MRVRVVLILAVLAFTGVRLAAHDFWLAASSWQPRVPRDHHREHRRHLFVPMTDPTTPPGMSRCRSTAMAHGWSAPST